MSKEDKMKALRREYSKRVLDENSVVPDPFAQFAAWFDEISKASSAEVNAVALATVDLSGAPSVRIVLLKEFGEAGFVFYTNYDSRKGSDLAANPRASLLFYWPELERQVRIEGVTERLGRETNAQYFRSRPHGAQLGSLVSDQSRAVASRADLDGRLERAQREFSGKEVPCPPHWGGYRLLPRYFEFWQGRENRLHDRICYQHSEQSVWNISRLYP